jgi:putative membrane protein
MLYQVIELYGLSQYNDKFILINEKIEMVKQLIFVSSISILATTLTLLIIELSHRIVKDSLWNYFKSVYQTIRIRQFLKQDELSETITFNENQTVIRLNPILREFNQSVSKCSIDIHNNEITVFMKIPRTQQSQKLLKDMEEHIKEEISSYNPNYYFSTPVRERNSLWFKGTKR